jgi:DNA helicase-2/ATP-dependent DNA helicase PcrA
MTQKIEDILATLNPRQREAVETIYWPVLVIAWPGSGKTQILGARIANILASSDYLPSNILCLTFTENAAKNMRTRLASMIGQDAYRVAIHTFHSFWNEILSRYKYHFREYQDANTVDDIMAREILDGILKDLAWNDPYKPGMRASETISELLGRINDLKKGGITPDLFQEILTSNESILKVVNPIISEHFERIDAFGRKKEELEKKIQIFEECTNMVQQMSENSQIAWYDTLLTVIKASLNDAWDTYAWDGSTKFLTAWKDDWTTKLSDGKKVLKETEKLKKQQSLANIYLAYQKELEERGYIDFNDMILRAVELVERDDSIQANLAEQYQFVLIDEFQDTNEAQMRLVNSILRVSADSPNIFAVWDDDQSIYKFQWANIKNIRDFHTNWNDTKLIILDTNYRSFSSIITESRTVIKPQMSEIEKIFPGATKEFLSARGTWWAVLKRRFKNEIEEVSSIVDEIGQKIAKWTQPESIAIIAKKNKSLELIAKSLLEKSIPVSVSKTESIFDDGLIRLILSILKYLVSVQKGREAPELLSEILSHEAWQIPRLKLWEISRDVYHARKEENKSWIERLRHSETPEIRDIGFFFSELVLHAKTYRLEDIIDMITGANNLSLPDEYNEDNTTSPLQIDMFGGGKKIYQSPLYSHFFGQLLNHNWTKWSITQTARHLANIKKFVDTIRSYKHQKELLTINDATELLLLIETYDIKIEASHVIGDDKHAINLITVHKAKGLEWEHVYAPFLHAREYKLGRISGAVLPKNLPLEADKDDEEDIERLIYTAYTRARESLHLSFSDSDAYERSNEPLHCISIESDDWDEITDVPITSVTETLTSSGHHLFNLPYSGEENDFLRDRIEKHFVLSVTALQNFLDIADGGPTHFVSNNILRFPQAKNIAASYGSAIHKALEDFFNDYTAKKSYKKEILHDTFEASLKKEWFPKEIETTWLARGHENIEELYTEITGKSYGELSLEQDFRTLGGGTFLGDIQLTGKIDRVEKLPDDSLIITDYKTGGGFSIFDGKWSEYMKIKQWKYRLQLAFYAILFELSPRYRMFTKKQFELFFVEKDTKENCFHRVTEYVHDGEIDRTKRLIMAVMKHIRELDFPDTSHYPDNIDGIRQFEDDLINWQI